MPIALPNLYCTPQDVFNQVGIEAAQLRLDDQNQASGQQVAATADAALGATSITIAALQYPMLRGTTLEFSAGGMSSPAQAVLSAVAAAGATTLTVGALAEAITSGAVAIDNGVNVWLAGLMVEACKKGTRKCKLYLCGRYDDSQLVLAGSVNSWCTACAAHWLSERLYRAAPTQVQRQYEEAIEEMKLVQASELNIEDIGTRTSGWPFLSNVTVDLTYTIRKVRVESSISEPTQTQYPQAVDWSSALIFEW